jgi:hypothetical protein
MKRRILTNPGCKVQQLFFDCLRQWLVYPDNITPDLNHIPMAQRELVALALQEQQAIGWHLCFRGYLSRHWALAVAAHPSPPVPRKQSNAKPNDFGSTWSRTTVSELWDFARAMWVHRNSCLHDPTSLECRQLKGAAVNAAITALYDRVDTFSAQDRWRFDLPLALRLRTRLSARNRWLRLTKILIDKSTNTDPQGQSRLTTYFQVINQLRPRLSCLQPVVLPASDTLTPAPLPPLTSIGRRPQVPASRSL